MSSNGEVFGLLPDYEYNALSDLAKLERFSETAKDVAERIAEAILETFSQYGSEQVQPNAIKHIAITLSTCLFAAFPFASDIPPSVTVDVLNQIGTKSADFRLLFPLPKDSPLMYSDVCKVLEILLPFGDTFYMEDIINPMMRVDYCYRHPNI